MENDDNEPDWGSFETYKGEEKPSPIPKWLQPIFHYFMILVSLVVVFCIGAFIAFFLGYDRRFGGGAGFALRETWEHMWMRMVAGGVIAIILLIYWRFRK
ncbi:MAG: hypothetical protein ACPG32_10515 [Akkermansiaceae bacterium]